MPEAPAPPLVTIILPVHDALRYLPAARSAVAALHGPTFELIAVDDGSRDGSAGFLATWAQADPRVRVLTEPAARGVAQARNRALAEARGGYVWFTDADDAWSPDILAVLVAAAQKHDADVVVCNARRRVVHDDPAITPTEATPLLDAGPEGACASTSGPGAALLRGVLRGTVQGHLWNKLFRRETLGDAPFPEQRAHSDLAGLLVVLGRGAVHRVAYVPQSLYTYRMRRGSILRSDAYDPGDLEGCLREGWRAAGLGSGPDAADAPRRASAAGLRDDLALFTHGLVTVPVVNEHLRRGRGVRATARAACTQRARVTPWDVLAIARQRRTGLAVRTAAIRWALPFYALTYRAYRRTRWSRLDRPSR